MQLASEEALDKAVDDAIRQCDGDARAAVKAQLVANAYLEAEEVACFAEACPADVVFCGGPGNFSITLQQAAA